MTPAAAVMTGPGAGAIATIQLTGDAAQAVLAKVFRPTSAKPLPFETGRILLGHIVDDNEPIDQVTMGCEGPESFAIHCHGNPIIVEAIMKLLERHGVELLSAQQLVGCASHTTFPCVLGSVCDAHPTRAQNAIAVEAKIALTTVKTLAGAKLIANQIETGLSRRVRQWKQQLESGSLDGIAKEIEQIRYDSEIARLLIEGCTIALVGPAGVGKSTLLNTLAGREKAIVTGVKGTTRDWVSAEIHLPPLAVTLIDTAGFVSLDDGIDQAAQAKSLEILGRADVVLLVLDTTEPGEQIDAGLSERLSAGRVIPVLNKSDLPEAREAIALPAFAHAPVRISAKQGAGIDDLAGAVISATGIAGLDVQTPITFTARQCDLLKRLSAASSCAEAVALVDEMA